MSILLLEYPKCSTCKKAKKMAGGAGDCIRGETYC